MTPLPSVEEVEIDPHDPIAKKYKRRAIKMEKELEQASKMAEHAHTAARMAAEEALRMTRGAERVQLDLDLKRVAAQKARDILICWSMRLDNDPLWQERQP